MSGEGAEGDVVQAGEDLLDDPQSRRLPVGQVHLGHIARDDHRGSEAEPGQEHLHLLRRGVLRLVEDDERVVKGSTPHVGQWRDLDRAAGCLLYTSPSPRDRTRTRMPSSA